MNSILSHRSLINKDLTQTADGLKSPHGLDED